MIDRLKAFDTETDKVDTIIQSCNSLEDTRNASTCIDHYEKTWMGYDGDVEKSVLRRFRDELCDITFDLYSETRLAKLNINIIQQ
jgi:hypothetical protein